VDVADITPGHRPYGAPVARLSQPAGRAAAEKGRPVPLVGQSERGRDALPVSIERTPGELVQTQHRVWQASGRICMRPADSAIGRSGLRTRARHK
jgi:hypothetical protein